MEEFVFTNFAIPLFQNTIVAILKTLYREYTMSFEFYPTSFSNYWACVVHLTAGEDANFLIQSKLGSVCVASSKSNRVANIFCINSVPLKHWSSIKISQKLVNLDYIYNIYLNESIVYSKVNIKPVVLSNVKVYAADPWNFAQSGFIRNLSIINRPITSFFYGKYLMFMEIFTFYYTNLYYYIYLYLLLYYTILVL